MRTLFGILFLIRLVLTLPDLVVLFRDTKGVHPFYAAAELLFTVLLGISAYYLLRSQRASHAEMACPSCQLAGGLRPRALTHPRPRLAALFLGSIPLLLLCQHLRPYTYQCSACETTVERRAFASRLILAWCLWAFLIVVAVYFSPDEAS